ncbi:hypothetical protein QJS10_CPB19g01441 [Acorus calamus]|uniref:Uncharacterized protein n=1 Tax=Acorus calamus TaxID=4465 RepID=A0AAV9CI63_ACOCL|nr:hypothetical protein QJS10_CPB19g01441 [Acorus calamus]
MRFGFLMGNMTGMVVARMVFFSSELGTYEVFRDDEGRVYMMGLVGAVEKGMKVRLIETLRREHNRCHILETPVDEADSSIFAQERR